MLRDQAILSYKKPPPDPIETVETSEHGSSRTIEHDFDRPQREGGAFATAAVDAYFSRLEHLFCLALAFAPPNIKSADFKSFLASSWSAKMKTLIDIKGSKEAKGFYDKLRDVRAEWRNPIAHGGFLSDGESLYFHLPDVGAVPARMRRTPKGIQFGLQLPHASFEELLELFDGFDTFLAEGPLRYPVRWAATQMSVVFDPVHRKAYREAMSSDEDFETFIDGMAQALDRSVNMDW